MFLFHWVNYVGARHYCLNSNSYTKDYIVWIKNTQISRCSENYQTNNLNNFNHYQSSSSTQNVAQLGGEKHRQSKAQPKTRVKRAEHVRWSTDKVKFYHIVEQWSRRCFVYFVVNFICVAKIRRITLLFVNKRVIL